MRIALLLLLTILLAAPPVRAAAPVVEQARALLLDGSSRLAGGDLRGAEGALEQARSLAGEAGELELSLGAALHLAEVFARTERMSAALALLAESMAKADGSGQEGLGLAIRLQAAEMLRAHGRLVDSEALAWEALTAAIATGEPTEAAAPIRLILLNALDQGAKKQDLAELVQELDLQLSGLDAYRLALPPPPEPIVTMVAALGQQLASAGQVDLAAETLLAVAAVDAARGAESRLPSDLARVAWAATQQQDFPRARWAAELALAIEGDRAGTEVLGAACDVALAEERWSAAKSLCGRAAKTASVRGDGWRSSALTARVADALEGAGDLEGAERTRAAASKGFREAGQLGDSLVEQAQRARVLATLGRFEAADRELLAAVAAAKETGAEPAVNEERLRVALLEVRAARVDEDRAQQVLDEVGRWLWKAEDADELAGLAAFHAERALATGDLEQALEAAEHAVDFERQLGFADEGWRGLEVRSRVHEAAGRAGEALADLQEAARRARLRLPTEAPPRRWFGPGPEEFLNSIARGKRTLGRTPDEARAQGLPILVYLIRSSLGMGRFGAPTVGFGAPERVLVELVVELEAVRALLHRVSFRGGDRTPEELRAELEPQLRSARLAVDASLAVLLVEEPLRAVLWGAGADSNLSDPKSMKLVELDATCSGEGAAWAASIDTELPKRDAVAEILAVAAGQTPDDGHLTARELATRVDLAGQRLSIPGCALPSSAGLAMRIAALVAGASFEPPVR